MHRRGGWNDVFTWMVDGSIRTCGVVNPGLWCVNWAGVPSCILPTLGRTSTIMPWKTSSCPRMSVDPSSTLSTTCTDWPGTHPTGCRTNKKNVRAMQMGRVSIVQKVLEPRLERGGFQRRDVATRFVDGEESARIECYHFTNWART